MWRGISSKSESRTNALFAQLVRSIATRVLRTGDLNSRLMGLATAVTELPGIVGAMFVACDDEGFPLAYKAINLSWPEELPPLQSIGEIRQNLMESWVAPSLDQLEAAGAEIVLARNILDGNAVIGMTLISLVEDAERDHVLAPLEQAADHFKWAIRDALQLERKRLFEEISELEEEELGRVDQIDPQRIVESVRSLFNANAVTLLVREQGKLYLSATTDLELAKDVVAYDPGEGLTGFILDADRPFRLRDAYDKGEVQAQSGGGYERIHPVHPEAISKTQSPRFLAVTMRSGGEVRGVIRLLREDNDPPFTRAEQDALQHFANMLAMTMQFSWRLHLADSVMEAETEAICITRNEPGKGVAVPIMVQADAGAESLFGLEKGQIEGKDARLFYAKNEYKKTKRLLENAIRARRDFCGPIKSKVKRSSSPTPTIRSVEISYRLVTSPFVQPSTHYTIAVIRDITEAQVKAEQHQRLVGLLDKQGLVYFRADEGGRNLESSPAESRITGYSLDELLKMHRKELYAEPSDRDELIDSVDRRGGQLVYTRQEFRRKNGTIFLAGGTIHLLRDEEGRRIGYEGLYEDVTNRVKLEAFLDVKTEDVLKKHEELYKKLEENADFQLLFMTSLSHQLRSPLSALAQHLLNFKERIVDADRFSKGLEHAIGQTKVCGLLLANLTYMDKLLRDESFYFDRVPVAKLAIETKLNFRHFAAEKEIVLAVDGDSISEHLDVWGHRELLRQTLVNLVDNAIKYSAPGSRICIRGCQGPNGRYLQVSNRGISIPAKYRKDIFERGFRMPTAMALTPDGSGLGLWLVHKILEAHGASIRCTEVLEEGRERTAFQIFFPSGPIYKSRSWRKVA